MGTRLLQIACLALAALIPALAQTQRGQISGRISDASGAFVPGAKLELTNPEMGVSVQAESNVQGLYTFPFVAHGKYNLRVTATGFAVSVLNGVEVATSTTTTANVELKVAQVSEQVTAEASPVVLETTTSVIGAAVEEKLKQDLPNLVSGGKRNPFSYIFTAPTVNRIGQLTIGGGRTNSHELLVDGQTADVQSSEIGSAGQLPSVEAIGEFKMVLNSMSAEYGRSSGGMTTFATKSGTNQYHGAAYWFLRNQKLDARTWQAARRDPRKQNEFGMAGGGPVIIPKVYNGTNKSFFWANVTGYKLRTLAASTVRTLPTQAMRQGDFSASDLNPVYDVLDPFTDAGGQRRRRLFPGNRIPSSRLSPVSKFFLDRLPNPTSPGSNNNFVGSARSVLDTWDFSVRGDQYIGDRDRLSGFYQWTDVANVGGNPAGLIWGVSSVNKMNRVRLDWNHNYRPNLIQQVLLGVNRNVAGSRNNSLGQNLGQASGLKGTFSPECPEIWFDRPTNLQLCSQLPVSQNAGLVSTFNYSLLWVRGAHNVKFGNQLIRYNQNQNRQGGTFIASASGSYLFTAGATADTNNTGGETFASYFLGYPGQATVGRPQILGPRETYAGFFIQDDWKISRKLTLNLGLRWDLNVPYTELHSQITGFDPDRPNPGATGRFGALTFYGKGPGRNGLTRPGVIHWKNFGPRLGFAYQIDSNTVFRGFAGIIYQGIQNANANFADRTGFLTQGSPLPPTDPFGLYYSWDQPFPQDVLGTVPNTDPAFRNGQAYAYQRREGIGRAPELYMASGGFQRQLPGAVVGEVTWLYNGMRHASDHLPINQLAPQFRGLGALLNEPLNSPQVRARGFGKPFPEFDEQFALWRALLPYPQYTGINEDASNHTGSTYHAVVFKAQKRFSSGLSFLASHTISKYLTDTTWAPGAFGSSPRDSYNRRLEKSIQRFDVPQRLVLAYSYELPFGKGRKYLASAGKAVDSVLGGWTVSGIHQYQSGTPLGIGGSLSVGIPTIGARADRVAGVPIRSSLGCGDLVFGNPSRNFLFNAGNPAQAVRTGRPLGFQPQGDYQIGNAPNTDQAARQCGIHNEDLSITKTFPVLGDRIRARLGAEFFNILNRHTWEYGTSGGNVAAANFGEITPVQHNGPRQVQLKLRIEF